MVAVCVCAGTGTEPSQKALAATIVFKDAEITPQHPSQWDPVDIAEGLELAPGAVVKKLVQEGRWWTNKDGIWVPELPSPPSGVFKAVVLQPRPPSEHEPNQPNQQEPGRDEDSPDASDVSQDNNSPDTYLLKNRHSVNGRVITASDIVSNSGLSSKNAEALRRDVLIKMLHAVFVKTDEVKNARAKTHKQAERPVLKEPVYLLLVTIFPECTIVNSEGGCILQYKGIIDQPVS